MAKFKMTEAQEEQLKNMVNEKKDNKEITEFFKRIYKIDLPVWKIGYVRNYKHKKAAVDEPAAPKRKYTKRQVASVMTEEFKSDLIADIIKDIATLQVQIDNGYKQVFKYMRAELIKTKARVQAMVEAARDDGRDT
jgi:hypothetical protein